MYMYNCTLVYTTHWRVAWHSRWCWRQALACTPLCRRTGPSNSSVKRKGLANITLQRTFDLCIPRKGIALPQAQFPHSGTCEQFTVNIPTISPPIFLQQNRLTDRGNVYLYISLTEAAQIKEFIIKMEGNTGEFFYISGSEIHGGRCVQSIR